MVKLVLLIMPPILMIILFTKDGQSYTYAASGTSPNTFGLALQAKTGFANNADINIDGSGTITIDDNSLDSVSSGTATTITNYRFSFSYYNSR